MNKIQSISGKFLILFKISFIVLPVLNFVVWIFYDKLPPQIVETMLPHALNLIHININSTTKFLAAWACMLQIAVILYALRQLIKLFGNYQQGEIFSLANVTCYRRLGYSVFAWIITDKIVDMLISFILTFQNAVGHRQIAFGFGFSDFVAFAIGGLIILIAWIMHEGHKLNEDQALTI